MKQVDRRRVPRCDPGRPQSGEKESRQQQNSQDGKGLAAYMVANGVYERHG
jgi:hypothetical protein